MEAFESCPGLTGLEHERPRKREKYLMNSKTIVAIVVGVIFFATLAAITMTSDRNEFENTTAVASEEASVEQPTKEEPAADLVAAAPVIEPLVCLDCHRSPNIETNEGIISSQTFCYDCHKEKTCIRKSGTKEHSLQVVQEEFIKQQPLHQYIACINCHKDVAQSPHKSLANAQCRDCHSVHGENSAHDPHLRVACQACHFESKPVTLNPETGAVSLADIDEKGNAISLSSHAMADMTDETSCEKCHFSKNPVGAPASVLPSKGFICIMCHSAPLAMGHPIFGVAFLIFLMGIFATLYFWYQGKVCEEEESIHRKIDLSSETLWKIIFSRQFFGLLKVFILDIVLQRRLLQESVQRWSMHALIFTSIFLRLVLGLFTSIGFFFNPESDMMLALIDKNHAFTAFANDLLGLFILIGIFWAVAQRYIIKPAHVKTEIQDNLALIIIGLLVFIGFLLEAARIASTGIPADMTSGAFIGAPLAAILSVLGLDWSAVYPYLWYAHGIMAALLIAYLPFGKMRHVFNTPLTYFIEKVAGVKRGERV